MKKLSILLFFLLSISSLSATAATLEQLIAKEKLVQGNPSMKTWLVGRDWDDNIDHKKALFLSVWGKHDKNGQLRWGVISQQTSENGHSPNKEAKAKWLVKPEYNELVFMPEAHGEGIGTRIYVKAADKEFFSVIYQEYRRQNTHPTEFTQVYAIPNITPDKSYRTDHAFPTLTRNLLAAYGKPDANGISILTLFEEKNRKLLDIPEADAGRSPELIKGMLVVPYAGNRTGVIPTDLSRAGFNSPGKLKPRTERYQTVGLHHDLIYATAPDGKIQLLQIWGEPLESAGDITALPEPVVGSYVRHQFKPYFVTLRLADGRFARRLLVYKEGLVRLGLFPSEMPASAGNTAFGDMVFLGQGGSKDFFAAQNKDGSWQAFVLGSDGSPGPAQWAQSSGQKGTITANDDPSTLLALLQKNNDLQMKDLKSAETALRQDKPAFIRHVMQSVRQDKFGYYQPKSDFELAERYARESGGNLWGEWLIRFNRLSTMNEDAIAGLRASVSDPNVQAGLDRELANREQQRTNQKISAEFQAREAARFRERQEGAQRAAELFKSSGGAPGLSALEKDNEARKSDSKPYEIIEKKSN